MMSTRCGVGASLAGDRAHRGVPAQLGRGLTTNAAAAAAFSLPTLRGRCSCGSVGWDATGPSALNFTCHCSVCRGASGQPFVQAAGFKPEQVSCIRCP